VKLETKQPIVSKAAAADLSCPPTQVTERRWMERRTSAAQDRRLGLFHGVLAFANRRSPHSEDRRQVDRRSWRFDAVVLNGPWSDVVSPLPLDVQIGRLLRARDLDTLLVATPNVRRDFGLRLKSVLNMAFAHANDASLYEVHRALYLLYGQAFVAPQNNDGQHQFHPMLMQARREMEAAWESNLEAIVRPSVDLALAAGQGFEQSLTAFCAQHRLARHPFFDFVEHEASRAHLVKFFLSDSAVVLRFFDLLVLSLVGADDEIRGELVDNLWDEMGHRDPKARHTQLFLRLLHYVGVEDAQIASFGREFHDRVNWPCLAGHNLYLLLGTRRQHYFRSLGCLGSAELMDAAQYAKIVRGCQRLGWNDSDGLAYYISHAEADAAHGLGWLDRVLLPLVAKYPNAARDFLMGTAFRLETAAQYYDSLLVSMQGGSSHIAGHDDSRPRCAPVALAQALAT
jgi:pyrroloquinoline quinone (PQQ) biosynthesis protein C